MFLGLDNRSRNGHLREAKRLRLSGRRNEFSRWRSQQLRGMSFSYFVCLLFALLAALMTPGRGMYTRTIVIVARGISGFCTFALALLLASCRGGSDTSAGGGTSTYTVGGTISGLSGAVMLQNNGGNNPASSLNRGLTLTTPPPHPHTPPP